MSLVQEIIPSRPNIIICDGPIGAGKTTFINECLAPGLRELGYTVDVVDEPVSEWATTGILEKFYSDPKRWAYTFQTKAFYDRVQSTKHAFQTSKADIIIFERSIFSDPVFVEILYNDNIMSIMEYNMYWEWWFMWSELVSYIPDLFIYLRPSLDTCMERVNKRCRSEEVKTSGVTREYQSKLIDQYDKFLGDGYAILHDSETKVEVLTLATNENFISDKSVKKALVEKVYAKISAMEES